jgi:hypothetical protein
LRAMEFLFLAVAGPCLLAFGAMFFSAITKDD